MTLPTEHREIPQALTPLEVKELRRFYLAYIAKHDRPSTWGLRSEVFESLVAAALCASHGFSAEDVRLVEFIASFEPQDHPDVPKLRSLASRISALLPEKE